MGREGDDTVEILHHGTQLTDNTEAPIGASGIAQDQALTCRTCRAVSRAKHVQDQSTPEGVQAGTKGTLTVLAAEPLTA